MKRARVTEELAYGSSALDRLTGGDRPAGPQTMDTPAPPPASAAGPLMIKLSVFLNHGEDAYLEGLASTAKFSGGKKLSKTKLVEAMVRAFRATDLDVRGVKDDQELFKRVAERVK